MNGDLLCGWRRIRVLFGLGCFILMLLGLFLVFVLCNGVMVAGGLGGSLFSWLFFGFIFWLWWRRGHRKCGHIGK